MDALELEVVELMAKHTATRLTGLVAMIRGLANPISEGASREVRSHPTPSVFLLLTPSLFLSCIRHGTSPLFVCIYIYVGNIHRGGGRFNQTKAMNEMEDGRDRATPASVRHDDEKEEEQEQVKDS